ncbi:nucleoside deaminase [Pusillimonas sp. CC-YST705]|uniref:Nucleoside deaminase n=1 Tax=Mesopusillimonas faecipullorum TaxID=2755040 RepID=A0ABS8CB37_9BURK|nr:nucleoside deaminase [Mesopusillimonas faecipullorum]MCB5363250.1 nucleoside deaminase [Mesopusillimonas faecipullorum]
MIVANKDEANHFLATAIKLAHENVLSGGRPFGAVIVNEGKVIATGVNEIHRTHDLTAHAELLAIRTACASHGPGSLKNSTVYASGHPCPMCMAAMRMAGVQQIFYAYSNEDGAPYHLSTADIYADLRRPFSEQSMSITHLPQKDESAPSLYEQWAQAQKA